MEKTCFVDMCDMFRSLSNIAKTVVLLQEEHVCDACLLTSKSSTNVVVKAPKPCPDHPKSSLQRPQVRKNDQHDPKKCKKRSRTSQERKKGAPERKMRQHDPNKGSFDLHFLRSGPPLVRTCSMLMQEKNAVGFNTPGAASSAADLEAQEAPKSKPKPEKIDVEKQIILGINF